MIHRLLEQAFELY